MPRLKCPRCGTVIDAAPGASPVCPSCGFGSSAPPASAAPPMASAPSPPPTSSGWASSPPPGSPPGGYPQGGFGAPPAGGPGMPGLQRNSGKAIAALVLGICSLCIPYIGILTSIPAIVLGIMGMKEVDRRPAELKGKGMAIAGLVMGIVALVGYIVVIALFGALFMSLDWDCIDDPSQPGCEDYRSTAAPGPAPVGLAERAAEGVAFAVAGPLRWAAPWAA